MKKYILLTLIFLSFSAWAQRSLCDKGGFEQDLNPQFSFFTQSNTYDPENPYISSIGCNYQNTSAAIPNAWYTLNQSINNFNDAYTIVDNSSLEPVSQLPRVNSGSRAIKLNDNTGNKSITRMSYTFELSSVTGTIISFSYLIVSDKSSLSYLDSQNPHFIARVYSSTSSTIYDELCIEVHQDNSIFTETSNGNNIYRGWQCVEFDISNIPSSETGATIEFIISDNLKEDNKYTTVYIDDICDKPCCENCPDMDTDVGTNELGLQEAEVCINAYNTIQGDATGAIYHAGAEIVLHDGFQALYGSTNHFYILGCTNPDEFDFRQATTGSQDKDVQKPSDDIASNSNGVQEFKVYPNPAQNELYITPATDMEVTKVSLYAIDGKMIMEYIPEMDSKAYTLNISSVTQGVYILNVETTSGEVISSKVVKN